MFILFLLILNLILIGIFYFLFDMCNKEHKKFLDNLELIKKDKKTTMSDWDTEKLKNDISNIKKHKQISFYTVIGCTVSFVLIILVTCWYTVDEGEGIILTQFGRVYDQTIDPGLHLKRPWASTIEWRTRLKSFNQKIDARTNDDMKITIEINIWWAVQPDKLNLLYAKVAKNYAALEEGFVIPGIRSALRDEIAKVDYRELNSNRDKYATIITKYVGDHLSSKYIIIDRINIKNVIPPASVNASIEDKLKAKQDAEKAKHRLTLAKREAQIRREEAKGISDAQKIIQEQLSPIYVQYEGIQMMKKLAGSQNTTFIFIPASSKGAGVPMVWNAPIK